ncbi:hypothetical protein ACRN9F_24480 [Shewanella oncorhynchi]|uniref:hypothetical protein n=1 Tax=Shewanella oncorhynchi TaxID=2726434 RepID=UPI0025C0E591|nr:MULTISPECIES: hypothetical protein [unclassified Halomonas]
MKNLNVEQFLLEAGIRVPQHRDMSVYDGKPFQCACGNEHEFQSYMDYRNFVTSGANAKMIVTCPRDPSFSTLIKTKYKFLVIFDKFISLAGCKTK